MTAGSSQLCTLISASCTTGWFDWIHGELWLCPEGLLRRSLGLSETVEHAVPIMAGAGTMGSDDRQMRTVSETEIQSLVAADKRNVWIPWHDIETATLKRGIIDHSLHVRLREGRRAKFLWLKADGGYDLLRERLGRILRDRFVVVNRPIG